VSSPVLSVRVHRKRPEALDICSYELVAEPGVTLPPFDPGSHIDVLLPNGLVRQYSLVPTGDEQVYRIAVLRTPDSRGGSRCLHESVEEGQVLTISPPRNHFALAAEATHSLLFAGGIGITPILSMALALSATGAGFELHYSARSAERAAFLDWLMSLPFADKVHRYHAGARLDAPTALGTPRPGTHVYVCGPQRYIDAVLTAARQTGWPEHQLHWEHFGADITPRAGDSAFTVRLARSSRDVEVGVGVTVVEALRERGIEIDTSCEQGVCGTCLTRVLSGTPDHRDQYLTPAEQQANDQFTPCCSRSRTQLLVLDL
jgi:vanillate monooxygenase ferredoxin subunit